MYPGDLGMVDGGVVVLVVVVEFESAGPVSVGTTATAAAPATITPDEQIAARIFDVIR
ncbi:hypothetical protein [Mycobacterium sp. 3519A]|jgi:hypothetical protein|uniref:hypothetical protein n=1 Tax=Mycobacterium sp. 3519A TaxID=2057184 RepID=UPI001359C3BE|nr:hypothetical protein [Mycobacterium sp. 3519A]